MFLIGAIKPIEEKKLKPCFIFTQLFRGVELRGEKKHFSYLDIFLISD